VPKKYYVVHEMTYESAAASGMSIDKGNCSTRRIPSLVPTICPPRIPHALTCDRTQATALRSGRLILSSGTILLLLLFVLL
jgi:hypothetical protein